MSTPTPEETISYPSIALVLALGFVLYRYFFASQSPSAPSSSTPTRNNGLRFTPAQVDQVSAMFPQLSRRDIMWDLQRNRGSVQGTIERVLGGGRLDAAPPSFQPNIPPAQSQQSSASTSTVSAMQSLLSGTRKTEPDLITRYNLQSRIVSDEKGKQREESRNQRNVGTGTWATTKESRQEALRQRRDKMILDARRKMMERDAGLGEGQGQTPVG